MNGAPSGENSFKAKNKQPFSRLPNINFMKNFWKHIFSHQLNTEDKNKQNEKRCILNQKYFSEQPAANFIVVIYFGI